MSLSRQRLDGESEQAWHERRHRQLRAQLANLMDEFRLIKDRLERTKREMAPAI